MAVQPFKNKEFLNNTDILQNIFLSEKTNGTEQSV